MAPILQASAADDLDALKMLIQYDANLELREVTYASTAGPALALAQKIETLDWLLQQGANINFADEEGRSLLHLAINRVTSVQKVQWLLDNGVSINSKDKYGDTAINMANNVVDSARYNIERYRTEAPGVSVDSDSLQTAIVEEEAIIGLMQQILALLQDSE